MASIFNSYKTKKQNAKWRKCAKMRQAKERKRLEAPAPEYPHNWDNDWVTITTRRCINGHSTEHSFLLVPAALNSYQVWDDFTRENLGVMSMKKAQSLMGQRFPKLRRIT